MTSKILIISDDVSISLLLTFALKEKNYLVRSVNKSVEGLEECLQYSPNLVVIKYSSIGEPPDGATLCRHLRNHPDLATLPILVISAKRGDAFQVGASVWFDLVFNIEQVLEQIAMLVSPASDIS